MSISKSSKMNIGVRVFNSNEGRIFFPNMEKSMKCTIENGLVYIKERCNGCGTNEVKKYKCAYCGNNI